MQRSKIKEYFTESIPPGQGELLLAYLHRLHQARMRADLPGRLLLRRETKRVKEKVLFEEALA